ncbi:hypothetical protein NQ314_012889 [Rhamnusium bicolor]|uniref:Major facilitator superfamily (MFS) profile domain-containing protein n=1 Tax=Rhamnusium bicolor TaxID=1586634 RepID=A0AAV8XA68_9CUCU|nr:hypothetical protein NQ314_012889 [Rhamnusium bicolor]
MNITRERIGIKAIDCIVSSFTKSQFFKEKNTPSKKQEIDMNAYDIISALGAGTVLGWTANITDDLKAGKLGNLKITDTQLSLVGSLVPLGAMLICVPVGVLADLIGRKLTILLSSIPFIIGWLLVTFPMHINMIYAGRLLTGLAGGSFCVTAPMYTSEIAQTEIRGTLGTCFQLFVTIGILLVYVCGHVFPMMLYNLICLEIPIGFALVFMFQSETPVYSLRKGQNDKAEKAFRRLRGPDYNPADEIKAIQEQIAKEQNTKSFWVAMGTKAAKKATLICFMLMVYQQLSGINAVIFYSKDIFIAAESSLASHWCTIVIGAVQVVATLVEDAIKSIAFIPILSLVIFIIAFSLGSGPLPWVACSEIFPPDVMAKCSSAAGALNWSLAFLVTMFYHRLAMAIGNDVTFYIFAAVSFTGVFFVIFVMPETKGKTFAQIQAEIGGE